jgi:hypothetical protein
MKLLSEELYLRSKKIIELYESIPTDKKNNIKLDCKHKWEINPDNERQMVCRICYSIMYCD